MANAAEEAEETVVNASIPGEIPGINFKKKGVFL